mgnify:CR=1 FL=1
MSMSDWGENLDDTERHSLGDKDLLDGVRGLTRSEDAALACHRELLSRLAAQQQVIDRLPKTADGVTVAPGTATWSYMEFDDPSRTKPREFRWGVLPWYDTERLQYLIGRTYSTRAAAEAAKGGG